MGRYHWRVDARGRATRGTPGRVLPWFSTDRPEPARALLSVPQTAVQPCIVHMAWHTPNFVSWKRRPDVAVDLQRIYTRPTAEEAESRLTELEERWDEEYPLIGQSWLRSWPCLVPFF